MNNLKPQRMSAESFESSSDVSVSGFLGKSQAVTIVVRAGMSGPARGTPDEVVGRAGREQAVPSINPAIPTATRPARAGVLRTDARDVVRAMPAAV